MKLDKENKHIYIVSESDTQAGAEEGFDAYRETLNLWHQIEAEIGPENMQVLSELWDQLEADSDSKTTEDVAKEFGERIRELTKDTDELLDRGQITKLEHALFVHGRDFIMCQLLQKSLYDFLNAR